MPFEVVFTPVFERDADKLDGFLKKRLRETISKITANPTSFKSLEHGGAGFFRARFEQHRVIFKVDFAKSQITLVCVGKRDNVYKTFRNIS